jgi:hypothetical protein
LVLRLSMRQENGQRAAQPGHRPGERRVAGQIRMGGPAVCYDSGMDENPYQPPVNPIVPRTAGMRTRAIIIIIALAGLAAAVILPAFQSGRTSGPCRISHPPSTAR